MSDLSQSVFHLKLSDPTRQRKQKPRKTGLTMVMDKGLGLSSYQDLIDVSGEYIDFIKLGFGTAGITSSKIITNKINISENAEIHLYPGGTFFEVAFSQNKLNDYFTSLTLTGFRWVEISDGTIHLSQSDRLASIRTAREYGLNVITEIGKKADGSMLTAIEICEQYEADKKSGSSYVILEGRESGKNVGLYDGNGKMKESLINEITASTDLENIIWEAPLKGQQVTLMKHAGCDINIGNVAPSDALALEALRRGLRSDTFFLWRNLD